jgi:hypothetical protein
MSLGILAGLPAALIATTSTFARVITLPSRLMR